jgi:hypothetical protein
MALVFAEVNNYVEKFEISPLYGYYPMVIHERSGLGGTLLRGDLD